MREQIAFYFEQKYCTGCKTCQVACRDKNNSRTDAYYRKVYQVSGGTYVKRGNALIPGIYAYWITTSCNHCQKPACIKNCPEGAIRKNADGIVEITNACTGCGKCVRACPYEAIHLDQKTGKAGKCDFCADELARGKPPVCVASCPMRALDYGPLEELREKYGDCGGTFGMPSAKITQPSLVIAPHKDAIGRTEE